MIDRLRYPPFPSVWVGESRTIVISHFSLTSDGTNLEKTPHGGQNESDTSAEVSSAAKIGSPTAVFLEETQQQDPTAPHDNGVARASEDVPSNATSSKAGTTPTNITAHEPKVRSVREGHYSSARRRNERVSQPNLGRESNVAKRSTRRRKTTASDNNREYGVEGRRRARGDSGGGSGDGDETEKIGAKPHHLQVRGRQRRPRRRYGEYF